MPTGESKAKRRLKKIICKIGKLVKLCRRRWAQQTIASTSIVTITQTRGTHHKTARSYSEKGNILVPLFQNNEFRKMLWNKLVPQNRILQFRRPKWEGRKRIPEKSPRDFKREGDGCLRWKRLNILLEEIRTKKLLMLLRLQRYAPWTVHYKTYALRGTQTTSNALRAVWKGKWHTTEGLTFQGSVRRISGQNSCPSSSIFLWRMRGIKETVK